MPLFVLLILVLSSPIQANLMSAFDIVKQSDKAMRGDAIYSEMTMKIIRPEWSRSMKLKSWGKGTDLALVLVTEPAKDKGSASLKRGNEMWSWLPSIERVIKIAPSMLSQSWMGSDFSNDDLINQSSIVVDYTHKLVGEVRLHNTNVWVIDAIAKEDAPVVWSRVRLWISKQHLLQRKVETYDEFGDLVSTMNSYDVKELGGRFITTKLVMVPASEPNNRTEIITHAASFNFDISDTFFSQQQMKQLRE